MVIQLVSYVLFFVWGELPSDLSEGFKTARELLGFSHKVFSLYIFFTQSLKCGDQELICALKGTTPIMDFSPENKKWLNS
jgi:hypothetical protein